MNKQSAKDSVYDLESVKLPVLSGFTLRMLVWLMESPFSGVIQNSLLGKAGILGFRKQNPDELPAFIPAFSNPEQNSLTKSPKIEFPLPEQKKKSKGFHFNSIADYAKAYREGIISPVEVAERFLKAAADIDATDKPMRAFTSINRDDILKQAEISAQRYKQGKPLSILDGVPIPIKDQFNVKEYPTTIGTGFMGKSAALEDAAPVASLRKTGAILAGKTNMHELGLGVTGLNPHHGVTRNPYNPGHHTGGSSSGSAAAVAAGLGPASLGADGGGSIRIPASFCGLVGLKPTFGRVSLFGDSQLCWSVEHVGPLAATVYDAAILYGVIAGRDERDRFTYNQPPISLDGMNKTDISSLTIGIYPEYFNHAEPETVAICESLVENLKNMGVKIREIVLPGLEAGRVAHTITIASEISQSLEKYHSEHHKDYGLDVRLNLAMARKFTSHDFLLAQRVRTRMIDDFNKAFKDVDVILSPTSGVPAPLIPEKNLPEGKSDLSTLFEIMRFATPANMTGLPAISFPAGYTKDGLPVGMHATGKAWQETTLFRLAFAAERLVERKKPQIYYDLLR